MDLQESILLTRSLHGLLLVLAFFTPFSVHAISLQDARGNFQLDYLPKRVVALEYSFVDALAIVGVSPIGIADDKDPSRIQPEVRELISTWTSVGTRSQPSLETIASLKPDLIIADINRHSGVYHDLQKIAPTLMLKSRHDTYEGHLDAARIIGKVVGKEAQMEARIQQHKITMAKFAQQLPQGIEVQFGIALDNHLGLHPGKSYVGTLLKTLGFKTPSFIKDQTNTVHTGLEQLLANNPEYLIIGHYSDQDITYKWQQSPLWKVLKAVRNKHVYHIDNPSIWSRSRGILAAEAIAEKLVDLLAP